MKKPEVAAAKTRSLAKGLIAGCIGGLAGTLAKTFAERMFAPQPPAGQLAEPVACPAAEPSAADALAPATTAAADGIRWGFGAAVGAAYGAVAEYFPAATAKEGASLGIALGVLTRQTALPTFGLSTKPSDPAGDVTPLVVYGLTTEFVRKWVRKAL